jgi:ketosteroid isomerase-like protein
MTTTSNIANVEAQIRDRIDNWAKAVRAKDVNGVMSHYASDILTFDLAPPLEYKGANAYRKNWEAWFPTFRGPIGYEIRDLRITASDDIAFCHSLNRISGTRTNGEETDVWVRATVGLRKINGKWMVTHEHISVPFYMDGSDKAALDLKP